MTTYVYDTFTSSGSVFIGDHTAELGALWNPAHYDLISI